MFGALLRQQVSKQVGLHRTVCFRCPAKIKLKCWLGRVKEEKSINMYYIKYLT